MEVVSSAKTTILSSYPDFDQKYLYEHTDNEAIDFQFFPLERLFIEVNKKSGLEFLYIKNTSDERREIRRIRKIRIENLYCVGCPKKQHNEIALGLSNGDIKIINYKNSEVITKFQAEKSHNSVTFLDINATDEYLASVYEHGSVNLYGLKTKAKLETINFDRNCTLARFNPTIKSQLAVASYKGSVFLYDIRTNRTVYKSVDCHAAPCRDICISPAKPHILLSAGYDCIINIFDTKRKIEAEQIRCQHPLSTIAISDCGTFCCVGNLKGELISYDLRNTKTHVISKKVHDSSIIRVAFVPNNAVRDVNSLNNSGVLDGVSDSRKSTTAFDQSSRVGKRDSFCEFLEFHSYNLKEKVCPLLSSKRDSFDWELLNRKPLDFNSEYRASTASKLSIDNRLSCDYKPRNVIELDSVESIEEEKDIDEQKKDERAQSGIKKRSQNSDHNTYLNDIEEEKEVEGKSVGNHLVSLKNDDTDNSANNKDFSGDHAQVVNKESGLNFSNKDLDDFLKLPADKNSTPNICKRSNDLREKSSLTIEDVMDEVHKMHAEINTRLNQLEFEIKYTAESSKLNIFTQNYNLWNQQMAATEDIREAVGYLLQTDDFVNEFIKLRQENEELKHKILELSKSK